MKTTLTVSAPQKIRLDMLSDLLITAFEGGIGYWSCLCESISKDESEEFDIQELDATIRVPRYGWLPLTDTGFLLLCDAEDDGLHSTGNPEELWVLDKDAITRGIQIMMTDHADRWASCLSGDYDADDADVFVQVCLFGEIVYG